MVFQIMVQALDGDHIAMTVEKNTTIDDVKSLVTKKKGTPRDVQRLAFGGKALRNKATLEECAITRDSTLQLLSCLRGGATGGVKFKFASLKCGTKLFFTDNGPDYTIIAPGFNVEGICRNQNCRAYGRHVWTNHGFKSDHDEMKNGKEDISVGFNIGVLIHQTKCPSCKRRIPSDSIVGCGFYRCSYAYYGFKEFVDKPCSARTETWDTDGIEYHDGQLDGVTWTSLMIAVSQISYKKKKCILIHSDDEQF